MYTDEQLAARAAGLREEQDRWNDVFATNLIDVLDKIDDIRQESRAELASAKQARLSEQRLIDATQRAAELENRLSEMDGFYEREHELITKLRSTFDADSRSLQVVRNATTASNYAYVNAEQKLSQANATLDDALTQYELAKVSRA